MKNKGISLILLVLIITILLVITTLIVILINKNSISNFNQEINLEEPLDEISGDFIAKYKSWPTTITDSKLNMFDNRIITPIDLRQFSSFTPGSFHFSTMGYYSDEKIDNNSIKNIEDFLNVTATIKNGYSRAFYISESDTDPYPISGEVINCSEENLTIKECFDKNWWFIDEISANADTFLWIDMTDSTNLYNSDYDSLLIDRFISKFGGPSRIGKVFYNYYILYFTFNEFTIQIDCTDYGKIYELKYYPNEVLTYMQLSDIEESTLTEDTFFLK